MKTDTTDFVNYKKKYVVHKVKKNLKKIIDKVDKKKNKGQKINSRSQQKTFTKKLNIRYELNFKLMQSTQLT